MNNQQLLRDITRATVVPYFMREIERGFHDFQLAEIIADNADERLVRAAVQRMQIVATGKNEHA